MKLFISSKPEALAAMNCSHTVEAEYGSTVVLGSKTTLAHHQGEYKGNKCPCLYKNGEIHFEEGDTIGISHMDWDTFGGVTAILGTKLEGGIWDNIWELMAFVDLVGPHKIHDFPIGFDKGVLEYANAMWAYSEDHRVFAPRDGSVEDIFNSKMTEMEQFMYELKTNPEEYLAKGAAWAEANKTLEEESLVDRIGNVIVRQSDKFVNHLYAGDVDVSAVVALNTETGSITLSFSDAITGWSACDIMQEIFGMEAGGHDGIAGTPRDVEYDIWDTMNVVTLALQAVGG